MWVASCFVFDQNIPELFSYSVKIFRFEPQKLKHARLSVNFTSWAQIIQMVSLFDSIIYYFTLFYSFVRISTCLISEQLVSSGLWTLFYFFFAGKLYKSKVCFTKHLWEHSVYWDLFDALKNQERVLSIQAAIILSQPYLEFLLVTSPTSTEKKKDDPKSNQLHRKTTTRKRQRESSTCSVDF